VPQGRSAEGSCRADADADAVPAHREAEVTDVRPLDAFAELCFHVLASVPLDGPGSSYAPDYLAWARAQGLFDADARDDGEHIARLASTAGRELLHAWPRLHHDLAAFGHARRFALAELATTDVDDPATLAAIQRAADPALELLHARLGLALPHWTLIHARVIAPALDAACLRLRPLFAEACARVPSFVDQRIELSWVLGPRGRAHPERSIVGAPAAWHEGDDAQSVVIALHEHAVRDLGHGDWTTVEWFALRRVSSWLANGRLASAHRAWLASLDLTALVDEALARGWIDPTIATRLLAEPAARPALLVALD
jgi:hypothetical protein